MCTQVSVEAQENHDSWKYVLKRALLIFCHACFSQGYVWFVSSQGIKQVSNGVHMAQATVDEDSSMNRGSMISNSVVSKVLLLTPRYAESHARAGSMLQYNRTVLHMCIGSYEKASTILNQSRIIHFSYLYTHTKLVKHVHQQFETTLTSTSFLPLALATSSGSLCPLKACHTALQMFI